MKEYKYFFNSNYNNNYNNNKKENTYRFTIL